MDTTKYKSLFLKETNGHLTSIESTLLALEANPLDKASIDALFRHYHSIKGMSASMGYPSLKDFSHVQEDLLQKLRSSGEQVSEDVISALLSALDIMQEIVRLIEIDEPYDIDTTALKNRITELADAPAQKEDAPKETTNADQSTPLTPTADKITFNPDTPSGEDTKKNQPSQVQQHLKLSNIMKVESHVFDDLLRITGDLLMSLSSIKNIATSTRSIELKEGIHNLGKSVEELNENILSARMLPFKNLTVSLPRIVRDISKSNGKEVGFRVDGEDISLDRSILEGMSDPLVHMIRNSVDHGIEAPNTRVTVGKPAKGTITVRAFENKDRAIIEVFDDGKGIDVKKLKEKAIANGMDSDEVRGMSNQEALQLICKAGLSTKITVTEVSGRGVGMDIVKSSVEEIGGKLEIESVQGKYTKMIMELPKTASIIKVLLLGIEDEVVCMPISKITRILKINNETLKETGVFFNQNDVPFLTLKDAFGLESTTDEDESTVILFEEKPGNSVLSNEALLSAMVVDRLIDEVNAYIRPLTAPFSKLDYATGFTILGDGRPVFLLDLVKVAKDAR
ncbi:MAG: Hpt domain-containing protein [Deltaproteobacteria bacterium]|nr:Hpt domain-containing protein [Deltaproteobacteria bacterium]